MSESFKKDAGPKKVPVPFNGGLMHVSGVDSFGREIDGDVIDYLDFTKAKIRTKSGIIEISTADLQRLTMSSPGQTGTPPVAPQRNPNLH